MDPVNTQTWSPLLSLPAELRNKIYGYALFESDGLYVNTESDSQGNRVVFASKASWPRTINQLKFVNRQLNHETNGLELKLIQNKILFEGYRESPADDSDHTYPQNANDTSLVLATERRELVMTRAGLKFLYFFARFRFSALRYVTKVELYGLHYARLPLSEDKMDMIALNKFCTVCPHCEITYNANWLYAPLIFLPLLDDRSTVIIFRILYLARCLGRHTLLAPFVARNWRLQELSDWANRIVAEDLDNTMEMMPLNFRVIPYLEGLDVGHILKEIAEHPNLGDMGLAVADNVQRWIKTGL